MKDSDPKRKGPKQMFLFSVSFQEGIAALQAGGFSPSSSTSRCGISLAGEADSEGVFICVWLEGGERTLITGTGDLNCGLMLAARGGLTHCVAGVALSARSRCGLTGRSPGGDNLLGLVGLCTAVAGRVATSHRSHSSRTCPCFSLQLCPFAAGKKRLSIRQGLHE